MHRSAISFSVLALLASCSHRSMPVQSYTVEPGVSQTLAQTRRQTISAPAYQLSFDIPAQKNEPIPATETISFDWKPTTDPLLIDFKESRDHLHQLTVNGDTTAIVFANEHIRIEPARLKAGRNQLTIQFTAGNLSLNRNDEYLYTLLVPDRARTVFPCFDQPDLKATFALTLTIPENWVAIGNAQAQASTSAGTRKTIRFAPSDVIPTYLFSFVAGKFTVVTENADKRPMTLLHRETDPVKLKLSQDSLFSLHAGALRFLEDYTQRPYPFAKFDFAAIPDFQYGGMEHVGAIDYKASALFLDNGATRDQKLARASVIAHETAHMWFGDLVTMRWFNDVWLKEVFANFMADKVTAITMPEVNNDLKFVIDHLPAAYAVDRTEGANPIGQPLANLQEAGSLYGGIIYHKAPIMMRQLEALIGADNLRDGLREYVRTYAFGNATWNDLITILDKRTPADLVTWNKVWVEQTGRPVVSSQLTQQAGRVGTLTVKQVGEDGSKRVWPQSFELAFVYPDRIEALPVSLTSAQVNVPEATGKDIPLFVALNSDGRGYGRFSVDTTMLDRLPILSDPVSRAASYINLYENMLAGQAVRPARLATVYRSLLATETDELNLRLLTGQLSDIVWNFTRPTDRLALAGQVEQASWQAMEQAINPGQSSPGQSSPGPSSPGLKKVLFRLYQSVALSTDAQQRLYQIWDKQQAPTGVTLTEDDYTSLALSLAVRDYPAPDILTRQLARIKNPDRQKRLQFMMPVLSGDVAERNRFFASLADEKNREHEAWVTAALGYLHHPLRTATSVAYLPKSLDLLDEIQRTGDIFFPESWLRSTLSGYQTPDVAQLVRRFLADRPHYNTRLRSKLLQAADTPFRASKLLYQGRP
ncbi:aminopeptidase N [Spirosoma oryzae]|uniref:Aminopeptidase N n=1 Tax=Spirosoma oryzae TaxID=1469603 RepID=A0A2T0SQ46_9BACT|nr:M1 family aminopeptidase [Spirosoma oryzae]PRY35542.1 aminopeptidase N [Spirosoma oryzae]